MRQDPVVDLTTGRFTAVSLIPYFHTTGVVMRSSRNEALVGYCLESPGEVLTRTFGRFHVTRYNGYELFGNDDFEATTPMVGLGITPVEQPQAYGIQCTGRLSELLQLEDFIGVRREDPISGKDVQRIIRNLRTELINEERDYLDPHVSQKRYDLREILTYMESFKRPFSI